jgi:tricorn protease
VSEDDLWEVPSEGGDARRLTANPGTPSFPVLSPDGTRLAFTGRDDGPDEIYVMEAGGGSPRRLTWMASNTQVIGWARDGSGILASTDWRQPFPRFTRIVRVPLDGGAPEFLRFGPARAVSYAPDSKGIVLGRNSGDPSRWKRYRGGTAGTLWIDRRGTGQFQPLLRLEGNLANPMWIGDRIYFLSDHDGHGNLYSASPTGRDLRQHTRHSDYYVRFPSTDGLRIVYHSGADLYIFDPEDDRHRRLGVRLLSPGNQRIRKFVHADQYWESFDLHPKGHSMVSVHRGGLFSMGLWEGGPLRFGEISRVRSRLGTWLGDGRRIVAVTDEGGEESLRVLGVDSARDNRLIGGDFGRPLHLYPSPGPETNLKGSKKKKRPGRSSRSGDRVALTNHRHELMLVDLGTGRSRVLDRSAHHRIGGVAWSPDGRWLAYGHAGTERSSRIRLLEVGTGRTTNVTGEDFFDAYPSFDPDGRYLYFLSWRVFNPVYDSMYFDLGFPKGSRPYLVTLRSSTRSPFDPAGLAPRGPLTDKDSEDEAPERSDKRFRIDLEGISGRIVAFPVAEGRYERIRGVRGRALYTNYPVQGSLAANSDSEGPSGVLDYWDLERNKSGRIADKVSDFQVSLDARVVGVISNDRLRVVPSNYRDDPDRPEKEECTRETGWIDMDRIPVAVIPAEEWRQMYSEAWRLQREHFWRPDMAGTDWKEIHDRYLPLLDRVSSRAEFSDLMWEVQGELGASHCYEMGGDYRPRPNWRQGFLGADLDWNDRTRRWRITRIPLGDPWDRASASPLAGPGVGLGPGDEILEIGGERLTGQVSPYEKLVNMAGREVRITFRRRRGRGWAPDETATLRALTDESPLRYRDWVETRRAAVHQATDERVGYVHIPDMGPAGYAEFHRYFSSECLRDGLIIDVRFNRGGHVSQLLLEKLLRKRIGYDVSRWSEPIPYPDAAPMGPMVALTNEHAGSDGDIFCHAFKLYGLGPLIGKRTWGGVIGIWPRHSLVDGTVTTQPEFASWFVDVGYDVENHGTDPDIEVDNRPQDYAAGRDRQMDQALRSIRSLLAKDRPEIPRLGRETAGTKKATAKKKKKTRRG